MKRGLIILATVFGLATASFSQVSIGVNVPFSGSSLKSGEEVKNTESWVGVYGTIEVGFFSVYRNYTCPGGGEITKQLGNTPVLGVELKYGPQISLGGKDTKNDSTIKEYKNNGNIIALVLKYYFPMAEESRFHLYAGAGPEICMITREDKDEDDKYVETGELTNMRFFAPLGFDYDVNEDKTVKLGVFGSLAYTLSSNLVRSGTTVNYTVGAGLKYCF
ncbi:hypothetical protein KAW50_02340 [candidate division WOR-3 bacterium]|nr:hypothetical protein [candidate division WOR-3 bacterium]